MINGVSGDKDSVFIIYCKALFRGLILSIILLIITAVIFYFTKVDNSYIDTAGWIINILGICFSSIYGAGKIGNKGFIHGALIGILYIAVIFLISLITGGINVSGLSILIKFVMALIVGALSGMIGIVISGN